MKTIKFTDMRKILIFIFAISVLFSCNEREDYYANSNLKVNVSIESPLTACTSSYPGFIDLDYDFNIHVTPDYAKANPLPLIAQYTCENSDDIQLSFGNKRYTPNDTLIFASLSKKMKLNVTKPGTYRFLISFCKEDKKETTLGQHEFTFVIGAPDLNIYIVRDGKRVENLDESDNFIGYEGSFIVRVNSDKEDLNKGRLTLTANITGSSVQVDNWRDKESKISQSDDLPQTIDFVVNYKNVQLGKTRFVFTAQSANSSTVLRDSMNVQESLPGTFSLNTTYDSYDHFYSRPLLWIGQADSVEYLITPDPKSISDVYKLKFEMADPTKLWIFNTGDPNRQDASTMYEPNKWYDFSDKLNGKIYYTFPSPVTYKDTIYISMQNGEYGQIQTYKLFVQCRQSQDFDFNVSFKPTLNDGFDEIKFSELVNGVTSQVVMTVSDENPYAVFDYMITKTNTNVIQDYIRHRYYYDPIFVNADFQQYLGSRFGYLTDIKTFNVACVNTPTENDAAAYSANTFEWNYKIKRESDGKEKTVTRKIRIINDLLKFQINLSSNNREYLYQNEPLNTYQIKYDLPSKNADDYTLHISTTNPQIADIYLLQKDISYKKAEFNTYVTAPATHNSGGSAIGEATAGMIQVKGKQPGTATISFTLKHKSGAEQTIKKTIEVRADPVQYELEVLNDYDLNNNSWTPVPFGNSIHKYRNPRIRLKLLKSSLYSGNVSETSAKVSFNNPYTNRDYYLFINNVQNQSNTSANFEYNKDYIIELKPKNSVLRGWTYIGAVIGNDIQVTKANNLEVPIISDINTIRYTIREYNQAVLEANFESDRPITIKNTLAGEWTTCLQSGGGIGGIKAIYSCFDDNDCFLTDVFPLTNLLCYHQTISTGTYKVDNCYKIQTTNDATSISASGDAPVESVRFLGWNGTGTRKLSWKVFVTPDNNKVMHQYKFSNIQESNNVNITDNWGHSYDVNNVNIEYTKCVK